MANLKLSQQVNAPIDRVFQVFSDFPTAADRIEGIKSIEMLTDGPVGLGTRFKETRTMFGRDATEEMEITAFEPNRLYTVSADSCGAKFDTTFRFSESMGKTQVDMEMKTQAVTLFAKLMAPLGALMMGTMKKCIMADVNSLKEHCETG